MRRFGHILLLALLAVSCGKVEQEDLLCTVTVECTFPDGANAITLEVDSAPAGNYFRNMNTLEDFPIPTIVNNRCTMRVLKGAYLVAFDGTATFADGTVRNVRCAGHSVPAQCVELLTDEASLTLELVYLR